MSWADVLVKFKLHGSFPVNGSHRYWLLFYLGGELLLFPLLEGLLLLLLLHLYMLLNSSLHFPISIAHQSILPKSLRGQFVHVILPGNISLLYTSSQDLPPRKINNITPQIRTLLRRLLPESFAAQTLLRSQYSSVSPIFVVVGNVLSKY